MLFCLAWMLVVSCAAPQRERCGMGCAYFVRRSKSSLFRRRTEYPFRKESVPALIHKKQHSVLFLNGDRRILQNITHKKESDVLQNSRTKSLQETDSRGRLSLRQCEIRNRIRQTISPINQIYSLGAFPTIALAFLFHMCYNRPQ